MRPPDQVRAADGGGGASPCPVAGSRGGGRLALLRGVTSGSAAVLSRAASPATAVEVTASADPWATARCSRRCVGAGWRPPFQPSRGSSARVLCFRWCCVAGGCCRGDDAGRLLCYGSVLSPARRGGVAAPPSGLLEAFSRASGGLCVDAAAGGCPICLWIRLVGVCRRRGGCSCVGWRRLHA